MTTYVLCKTLVPWLCSRSQLGIKVIIRGLRGHLLHTVTFFVVLQIDIPMLFMNAEDDPICPVPLLNYPRELAGKSNCFWLREL